MKYYKTRLVALSASMVLSAAMLAPLAVKAQKCPILPVQCGNTERGCAGTRIGGNCSYSEKCLNCQ